MEGGRKGLADWFGDDFVVKRCVTGNIALGERMSGSAKLKGTI